ncbi:MAG: hypothetical protein GAK28_01900 [Luteibacter sp.]|uniref:hypothetical protein n=1 Tax=Luteibacter sp. TaxID=1886636 RepID=UPI00137DED86|nr:hypothetical protein [Luteibacter sp.]KAF1007261.1 MAG: hypothetical protein GAK28_01900 [Luteibacter sp.]
MSQGVSLQGRTILIAEDDPLIGVLLKEMLEEAGASVAGPFPSTAAARQAMAGDMRLDAALLDVNLADGDVYPFAADLQQAGVPYALFSAAGPEHMPPVLRPRMFIQKPAPFREILAALNEMLDAVPCTTSCHEVPMGMERRTS